MFSSTECVHCEEHTEDLCLTHLTCQLQVRTDRCTDRRADRQISNHVFLLCTCLFIIRLISVAELLSKQRLPCVSNMSWNTNQQQAWTKQVELSMPGLQALPRVNLLLIGCLRDWQSGEWRLMDASGSIRCEVSVLSQEVSNCSNNLNSLDILHTIKGKRIRAVK